jgi:hypothetical protein
MVPVDDAFWRPEDAMDETLAVNDNSMNFRQLEADYSMIYSVSDEELEAAAQGLQASWGTAGGWMSSTQQCCSPHEPEELFN